MTARFSSFAALASTLAASFAALALLAPGAGAEIPSVDAYGGQALVLGAPHHRNNTGGGGKAGGSGASQRSSIPKSSGRASREPSSGPARTRGATASPSTGGPATEATGTGKNPSHAAAEALAVHNSTAQPSQAPATKSAGNATGAQSGSQSSATSRFAPAAQVTASSAFSFSDVLLLLAGLLCLAAVAAALRLTSKPS